MGLVQCDLGPLTEAGECTCRLTMITFAATSPTVRILSATGADEPLAEVTLATRFGETLPIRLLLQGAQIDERVHALLSRVREPRALATIAPPPAIARSGIYLALAGTPVGFILQFAALSAWRDRWGKQALLEYPSGSHQLWSAVVWAGTGRWKNSMTAEPATTARGRLDFTDSRLDRAFVGAPLAAVKGAPRCAPAKSASRRLD